MTKFIVVAAFHRGALSRRLRKGALLASTALIAAALAAPALGADTTWTGANSGDWSDNGPDGPGFYKRNGNDVTKLQPGLS